MSAIGKSVISEMSRYLGVPSSEIDTRKEFFKTYESLERDAQVFHVWGHPVAQGDAFESFFATNVLAPSFATFEVSAEDRNGDRKVDREEVRTFAGDLEQTLVLFRKALDRDFDGVPDKLTYVSKQPTAVKFEAEDKDNDGFFDVLSYYPSNGAQVVEVEVHLHHSVLLPSSPEE